MLKNRFVRLSLVVGFLSLIAWSSVQGADTFHHEWWQVAFETPIAFSPPIKIGLGAVALVNPEEQGLGQGRMEIRLVLVAKEVQDSFGKTDAAVLAFAKSTFFQTDQPAQKVVERTFLGQKVKGESLVTKDPRDTVLETYLISLPEGDKMVLGFYREPSVTDGEAGAVMDMVAASFRMTD